ncbi:hypothetical protein [Yersinia aleksiciae]|uniref:hypothetical protein n=1 Tax=Yersinia aleksiciae TaxID=263819 RepID=UPI001427B5F5|nr:hypothetical protein [Yersinia aleksiciae]MDA5496962.1 hypothetical protein [Yersinia aleksiciae]NIK98656.1 hypothetical protein [Yersinia aleksiciae]WQC72425.1 hypothetical protein N0K21_08460 [Yersinia aleksiciae]
MAGFGMQITRDDGVIFASPEFTPTVLVQVMDRNADYTQDVSAQHYFDTIVPNYKKCFVFHKVISSGSQQGVSGGVLHYAEQGPSGYWRIHTIGGTAGLVHTLRFYVFSEFVSYIPEWGIYFFKNNQMVYAGNCLPLDIKFWEKPQATTPAPTMPCAVISSIAEQRSQGIPGTNPPTVLVFLMCFIGYSGGIATPVYRQISTGAGAGGPDGFSKGCPYIETALYDQYYKASLGYA